MCPLGDSHLGPLESFPVTFTETTLFINLLIYLFIFKKTGTYLKKTRHAKGVDILEGPMELTGGAVGGRCIWMRLQEVLCYNPRSWQGHVQSCICWMEILLHLSFKE